MPVKGGAGLAEGIEVFPRQDELGDAEFGNALRGPLGVHRAVGQRFWFYGADYRLEAQLEYLERLKKITEDEMSGFVKGLSMPEKFQPKPKIVLPPYDATRHEFRILDHVGRCATPFGKLLDPLPIVRRAGPRPKWRQPGHLRRRSSQVQVLGRLHEGNDPGSGGMPNPKPNCELTMRNRERFFNRNPSTTVRFWPCADCVCRQLPSRVYEPLESIASRQSPSNISISLEDTCCEEWNQAEPWLTWELIAAL